MGSRTAKNGIWRASIPASAAVLPDVRIREPEICFLDYGAVGAVFGARCGCLLMVCVRNIAGGVVSFGVA